jgi:hypothetical protein
MVKCQLTKLAQNCVQYIVIINVNVPRLVVMNFLVLKRHDQTPALVKGAESEKKK